MSTCLYISTYLQSGRGQDYSALAQSRNRHLSQTSGFPIETLRVHNVLQEFYFSREAQPNKPFDFLFTRLLSPDNTVYVRAVSRSVRRDCQRRQHTNVLDTPVGWIKPGLSIRLPPGMGAGAAERWAAGCWCMPAGSSMLLMPGGERVSRHTHTAARQRRNPNAYSNGARRVHELRHISTG